MEYVCIYIYISYSNWIFNILTDRFYLLESIYYVYMSQRKTHGPTTPTTSPDATGGCLSRHGRSSEGAAMFLDH